MRVRAPSADASAAPRCRPAFLQGKIPGATSSKGPCVRAGAVFEGVAPARADFRPPCAGRSARTPNSLPDKALARMQLLRGGHGSCCALRKTVLRHGSFPATTTQKCCAGGTTAREARESAP